MNDTRCKLLVGLYNIQNGLKGFSYLESAAQQKLPIAMIAVGLCYEQGIEVTQDVNKAIRCYERCADLGITAAYFFLGMIYINQINGKEKAIEFFYKASARAVLNSIGADRSHRYFQLAASYSNNYFVTVGVVANSLLSDDKKYFPEYLKHFLEDISENSSNRRHKKALYYFRDNNLKNLPILKSSPEGHRIQAHVCMRYFSDHRYKSHHELAESKKGIVHSDIKHLDEEEYFHYLCFINPTYLDLDENFQLGLIAYEYRERFSRVLTQVGNDRASGSYVIKCWSDIGDFRTPMEYVYGFWSQAVLTYHAKQPATSDKKDLSSFSSPGDQAKIATILGTLLNSAIEIIKKNNITITPQQHEYLKEMISDSPTKFFGRTFDDFVNNVREAHEIARTLDSVVEHVSTSPIDTKSTDKTSSSSTAASAVGTKDTSAQVQAASAVGTKDTKTQMTTQQTNPPAIGPSTSSQMGLFVDHKGDQKTEDSTHTEDAADECLSDIQNSFKTLWQQITMYSKEYDILKPLHSKVNEVLSLEANISKHLKEIQSIIEPLLKNTLLTDQHKILEEMNTKINTALSRPKVNSTASKSGGI